MTARYKVLLPIEIGETTHVYGSEIELDVETAKEYSHALVEVTEDGRDS
jgi:hypothetical protein